MSAKTTKTLRSLRTAPTERRAPKTISKATEPRAARARRAAGFTLIEILLVMAIIAGVMAIGLPAIGRITYQRINSQSRKFVGIVRTIRNDAILLNSIYRLVIDQEKRAYWIESQKTMKLIAEGAEPPPPKSKVKGSKGDAPPPSDWVMVEKYSQAPIPLPGGVMFDGVLKEKEGLIKEGTAYLYFFPSGMNDLAILYLAKDGQPGKGYSIVIKSTGGKVDIFRDYIKSFDGVN